MADVMGLFSEDTKRWFLNNIGQPTPAQAEGWPLIAGGGHVLISAPTGTGKTLAAFLVFLDRYKRLADSGELEDGVQLLYISPLKSLGNDIRENLNRPMTGIPCPLVRAAVRTGDTDAGQRRDMIKRPPHILITTPESLYLLLTSKSGRDMLVTTKTVIIDELHALIDGKRGAHLMLSLARLDQLTGRKVQRLALSATIKPLEAAARYLAHDDQVSIVAPDIEKLRDMNVVSVLEDMRNLPSGTIWPELAESVYGYCRGARTVIAFVEGRSQAEKLANLVNAIAGAGFARTHHGCVSKEQRLEAENQLRSGQLRLLVATSSMELGIDVGEVDLVLQIGTPLTVSGALQRLGRAGHNPGRTSIMRILPRMASEILACGMTCEAALAGGIERAQPPERCLDIVAQHVVSMAAGGEYEVSEMLGIVRSAHSFRDISLDDLEAVLRMLAGDYEHENERPARPRILYDRLNGTVSGDQYTRMLALSSGGTIPDRGWFPVTLEDGTRLGELDEEFVFEARVGDKFLLGAFAWRLLEIRRDRVVVSSATTEGARTPFWRGDGRGRSYDVGLRFGATMRRMNEAMLMGRLKAELMATCMDEAAANNALRHLERQAEITGQLPDDNTIIVEHFQDQASDHQIMVHSVFGRRVNMALELVTCHLSRLETGLDVISYSDDDGFLLYLATRDLRFGMLQSLDVERSVETVRALLAQVPLFSMSFRYNAQRALMMGARRGGRVPLWVQRMRGAETLAIATQYKDHPLIRETERECLEDYLDMDAFREVLLGIRSGAIKVHELVVREPSPMALPLRRQVEADLMYNYSPIPGASVRSSESSLASLSQLGHQAVSPDAQLLAKQAQRPSIDSPERLHSVLMVEGDMMADELDAPFEWLDGLAVKGRALYVEPGLWIAAEQAELYQAAIEHGDGDARRRIVRRCLRYRGGQTADSLMWRYGFEDGCELLNQLELENAAELHDCAYYHREMFERAVRDTIKRRREEVKTRSAASFQRLALGRWEHPGSAKDQLRAALIELLHVALPADMWEGAVLPARVIGYRPHLLDELLQDGELYFWMEPGRQVRFVLTSEIDWSRVPDGQALELTDDEMALMAALGARGASFPQALAHVIDGRPPLDALTGLMEKGIARPDSFQPVRLMLDKGNTQPKRRAKARASAVSSGRWELARGEATSCMEQLLEREFDRHTLLCRETCGAVRWGDALELLRVWEYTGRVRRGYYVRGLSGAQFLRAEDYERALLMLSDGDERVIWLNAQDPIQAWGRYLKHDDGRAFMLVPGTAVALRGGAPVAVFERGGEQLRLFEEGSSAEVLGEFARRFKTSRIYPSQPRITVKRYPDEASDALSAAGFTREMMDYVLWK